MPPSETQGSRSDALGDLPRPDRNAARVGTQNQRLGHRADHDETWGDDFLMSGITDKTVEKYLYDILPERDPVLREMEAQAGKRKIPIVGPAVARVFYQYARLMNARKIFEMGSAIGYSTIWWARAVGESGQVFYTDGDKKNAAEASKYFQQAGVADRIRVETGDALELLSEQNQARVAIRAEPAIRHHFQRRRQRRLSASLDTRQPTVAQRRLVHYGQRALERTRHAKKAIRSHNARDPGIQPKAVRDAGVLHNHLAVAGWGFGQLEAVSGSTQHSALNTSPISIFLPLLGQNCPENLLRYHSYISLI